MKCVINTIILLSTVIISASCRTTHKADAYARRFELGFDSCIIAHDLRSVIKKSDITTSITLHEYVMNEQGDTAIIRHCDIKQTQTDTISQHQERIQKGKTSTSVNDSICHTRKADKGTSHRIASPSLVCAFLWCFVMCVSTRVTCPSQFFNL